MGWDGDHPRVLLNNALHNSTHLRHPINIKQYRRRHRYIYQCHPARSGIPTGTVLVSGRERSGTVVGGPTYMGPARNSAHHRNGPILHSDPQHHPAHHCWVGMCRLGLRGRRRAGAMCASAPATTTPQRNLPNQCVFASVAI